MYIVMKKTVFRIRFRSSEGSLTSSPEPSQGCRICEAPRPQGGASRRGNFVHTVPLDPAYKAGLAAHVPVKVK